MDSHQACAAFAAEGLFTPVGWDLPDIWDPIAGNYQAQDGWIRLHTNYAYHRAAVERLVWGGGPRVRSGGGGRVEVRGPRNCGRRGRRMRGGHADPRGLAGLPAGAATAHAPAGACRGQPTADRQGGAAGAGGAGGPRPYSGVRVLDLTRVIAGPVGTRFLAAYGADVLRIDPPGFDEVPALLPETTAGKRTAALDLTTAGGRTAFEGLVATADVLVTGLRADALARLGYDDGALAALNPALIVASLDAYGPMAGPPGVRQPRADELGHRGGRRRGNGGGKPVPLPVQALDHGCGYLIAAAVGRALTRRLTESVVNRVRVSLIGTANLLWSLPRPGDLGEQPPMAETWRHSPRGHEHGVGAGPQGAAPRRDGRGRSGVAG